MIISTLIQLFIIVLQGVTSARPPWVFQLPASVIQTSQYMFSLDNVIPVSETFACATATFALFLVFNFTKWGIKVIDWVADIIP